MRAHPTSLPPETIIDGHKVEYQRLMELCHGGPEVGELYIDGKRIGEKARFGGPLGHRNGKLYIPMFRRSMFKSGFTVAEIDIESGFVIEISRRFPLIHINTIEGDRLLFYTDLEQRNAEILRI